MAALIHDPLTRLLAQICAIVVASSALNLVMRRIGQPKVIAEVSAGILLGPSLLGWLAPGAERAIFAPESLGALQLISQLGLILFMFIVGLELDPKRLRERPHQSVVISHTSIIVPFALGAGLAVYLQPILAEPGVRPLAFALFMGVAMSITAFPVLARILTERRLMDTRLGSLVIACAAVDDVTAWCILAFVVSAARANDFTSAIATTALAVGYVALLIGVARPLLARVTARIATPEGLSQGAVTGILLLLLLSSWATEWIGVHALFGAFVFGAILPNQGGFARTLAAKIEDLVLVILLPLFFAYSGVRTQIGLLDTPADWAICAGIVAVASLGKFGASTLAARVTGSPWREAGAVGILMNTRGLVELIVLNIGLDLGVIGPTVFTMMVIMALVTTFATTPLLRRLLPAEPSAAEPRLTPPAAQLTPSAALAQGRAPALAEFTMLLCIADERIGPGMAALASALADERSRVLALHLIQPSDRGSFLIDPDRHAGETVLAPLLQRARALALPVRPLAFVSTEPARDIRDLAAAQAADLVLLGVHKPLLGEAWLGGTVYGVMRQSSSDVAVFVDRGLVEPRRVLLPFLGGVHDRAAMQLAQRLLRQPGVELTVLHILEPGGERIGVRDPVAEAIREHGGKIKLNVVERASPPDAALEEARAGYDLVVIGLGSPWGLEERAFAVQPERLVLEGETSLLIVRGKSSG